MNAALTFDTADWVVVLLAVMAAVIAGLRAKRRDRVAHPDAAIDYILAGRSLTAPLFAATLIATWYGAVFGAGEFIARYGVVMILCFGVPYYIIGVLYALFIAKRVRKAETVSIPDQIRNVFGERAGTVAAVLILVISIPAPYMLTLGLIVASLSGLPLWASVIIGSSIALFIVAKGGLRSDVHANVVQVVLMYVGFGTLVVGCIVAFGSPALMWAALPTQHASLTGTLGWSGVAVWFLIALQTVIDPNFHVRAAAAVTPNAASKGLLYSVAGWIVFDGMQLLIGLYAVSYTNLADPSQTLLVVAQAALPTIWKGLFMAGVIAAVMSTLDGYALVSATTIGHDLIDRIRGGGHRRSSLWIGLAITGMVGVAASLLLPSILDLIWYAASIAVPALLLPLIYSYRLSRDQNGGRLPFFMWMIIPGFVSLFTIVLGMSEIAVVEPMFTGLIASVLLFPFARVTRVK